MHVCMDGLSCLFVWCFVLLITIIVMIFYLLFFSKSDVLARNAVIVPVKIFMTYFYRSLDTTMTHFSFMPTSFVYSLLFVVLGLCIMFNYGVCA